MKKYDYKIFIVVFSFFVYVFSSRILNIEYITLGRYQITYFLIYFLFLSLFSSVKGKAFLFDEIYRLWIYSFAPFLIYFSLIISIKTTYYVDGIFIYLVCFLISNFYKLNYAQRKYIALFRTVGFALYILGVSLNWKIW
ncbi:MAG: hypothetical protein H0Z24_04905 [Thermosipho sp. (in: Bacteria)]|nr:hypothetical protein [Thermosipho sp. (in: thermotogales)]